MILTDLLVIASRFVEYGGAMILFGSSLFLLYSHPFASPISPPGPVRVKYLLTCGALGLFIATALGFLAQTAGLAGSFGAAIAPDTLKAVLGMNFGPSSLIRDRNCRFPMGTARPRTLAPMLPLRCRRLRKLFLDGTWCGDGGSGKAAAFSR
jgi:hypothetical protein